MVQLRRQRRGIRLRPIHRRRRRRRATSTSSTVRASTRCCGSTRRAVASPSTAFAGPTTGTCRRVRSPTTRSRSGEGSPRASAIAHRGSCSTTPKRRAPHPLEAVDDVVRRRRPGRRCSCGSTPTRTTSPSAPDTVEVATFFGVIEPGRSSPRSARPSRSSIRATRRCSRSARSTRPTVRVASPSTPRRARPTTVASSPTSRRRRACTSTIYPSPSCFNGTSAASPAAAGMAALLLGRGLAEPGMPLASLDETPRRRPRSAGPRQRLRRRARSGLPAPPPSAVNSQPSSFTALGCAGPPPRYATDVVHRAGQPRRAHSHSSPSSTCRSSPAGVVPADGDIGRRQRHVDRLGEPVLRAGAADARRLDRRLLDDQRRRARPDPAELRHRAARAGFDLDLHPDGRQRHRRRDGLLHARHATAHGRPGVRRPSTRAARSTPAPQQAGPVPVGLGRRTGRRSARSVRVDVPAGIGVPTSGCRALVVNVTATESGGPGFLQALPTGSATRPDVDGQLRRRRERGNPCDRARWAPTERSACSRPTRRTSSSMSWDTSPTARHAAEHSRTVRAVDAHRATTTAASPPHSIHAGGSTVDVAVGRARSPCRSAPRRSR